MAKGSRAALDALVRILLHHHRARPCAPVDRRQDRRNVTLNDGLNFFEWAREEWPAPRWSVELDPWQFAPEWSGSAKPTDC